MYETHEAIKFYGIIGDCNPIEHDGGVVFEGDYGPQMLYFQGWSDDNGPRVTVSSVQIEENVLEDLNWVDWDGVASTIGMGVDELKGHAVSDNVLARAQVYESVASHYGWGDLDPTPSEITLEEAESTYSEWVDRAHQRSGITPSETGTAGVCALRQLEVMGAKARETDEVYSPFGAGYDNQYEFGDDNDGGWSPIDSTELAHGVVETMADQYFDTVRELLDELVYYDMGGDDWGNYLNNLVRYKVLKIEPLADPVALRVGFKVEVEDQHRDTLEEMSLWVQVHKARACGPWGRALSTPEGRSFVAGHELFSLYWMRESPRYEEYGIVLFDP